MIKIAIDSGPLENGHSIRGVGTYVSQLVKELRRITPDGMTIEAVDFQKEKDLAYYDILHFTFFNPYQLNFPKIKTNKWIVSIHDLIPLIYSDRYAPGVKGKLRFSINKKIVRKMDGIIAVSETTKKDLVRFLGVNENKVKVIYEAAKSIFRETNRGNELNKLATKYNLPKKFILYVGDVNYNKNLGTLIEASQLVGMPLVICGKQATEIESGVLGLDSLLGPRDYVRYLFGKPHPEQSHYESLLQKIENNKLIYRLGYIDDDELVGIFNLATVYVQPSLYEGFGLPILEAMSCGVPVVISKTQALVEIAGSAALVSDPSNPVEFAENIKKVFKDSSLGVRLIRLGKKRASEFSWHKTAKETLELYKNISKLRH